MADLNVTTLHGHLARDPELKTYKKKDGGDGFVVSFTIANNRPIGDETDWIRCKMFGARAQVIDKHMHKGSEILVTGRLQNDRYEKDGQKKDWWNVVVTDFDFCGKKDDNKAAGGSDWSANAPAASDSFEQVEQDVPW